MSKHAAEGFGKQQFCVAVAVVLSHVLHAVSLNRNTPNAKAGLFVQKDE